MQKVYINSFGQDLNLPEDKELIFFNNDLFDYSLNIGDIFVSYLHDSPLDFRLEYYNIPYDALVITTKDDDLENVLKEINQPEDYSIFSGQEIEAIKKETKVSILKSFKILVNVMYQMMDAGYLEHKNYKKIDDWILSFEEPILKLFKIYHGFEKVDLNEATKLLTVGTSNPSVDFEEEFLINPQFRQMLTIMLMKIISNFIINNNMVTLETVSELGDWQDKEVWQKLRKKVKLLK